MKKIKKALVGIYHFFFKKKEPKRCKYCGCELNKYNTYRNGWKDYCCGCEDLCRYTGNL